MTPAEIRKLADRSEHNAVRGYECEGTAPVLRALADVVEAAKVSIQEQHSDICWRKMKRGLPPFKCSCGKDALFASLACVEALKP